MKPITIAINGFGRIGRGLFRILLEREDINVVAINDLADAKTLAHLLKYDSIHGRLSQNVSAEGDNIVVDGRSFPLKNHSTLEDISWHNESPDIVIECTGKFKTEALLQKHIDAGASKVILAVPPLDDDIKTIVLGVNDALLDVKDTIVSNASCTTNNAAPMLKVVNDLCGVKNAYITTVHSYTTDQSLHDQPHRDLRRARAASQSIVPTTTGAAKALTKIFPELSDVIGGCGIRVPVPNGSLTDMTLNVKNKTTVEEINKAFQDAANEHLKGIIMYTEDPIVSVDIIGMSYSCIFDAQMTSVIDGTLVKLIGWYDNERGYSHRIIDLILKLYA